MSIKFEKTNVMNFEGAIRGMRNSFDSWDKSDSVFYFFTFTDTEEDIKLSEMCGGIVPIIGSNDLALAQKLIKAGSDHRKFLRQIFVSVDITAPLYWWKEFDTYKVGTVANSCSTMHTIHNKPIKLSDFSCEHLINEPLTEIEPGIINTYNLQAKLISEVLIGVLNGSREMYLKTKDKKYWWQMIQLLPSSYNQKRTVTLNYETLRNIYGSRRNHKLTEWSEDFMGWIDSLPYSEELIKI